MTRHTVHRDILLPVAIQAKAHRMIHLPLGYRLLPHVAMANRTIDSRTDVRRMIELHMRGRLKTVHALPGDVLAAGPVRRELLDLWLVRGDHLMAGHAEVDARNARIGPLIHAYMAIGALHAVA